MLTTVGERSVPRPWSAQPPLSSALRLLIAVLLALCAVAAAAGDLAVTVRAPNGTPVPDASLVLQGPGATQPARRKERAIGRVEQRDRHFVPQLLVVQTGTQVEFPNNDTVSHQVYSFSPPKRFQLSLYKGSAHPPIVFDKAGLVVLGCNIHDDMIGYILVTDSQYFAQTDAKGGARISGVAPGTYTLSVWAPRIADPPASLDRKVEVGESGQIDVGIQLAKALLAAPTPRPGRGEWDAY